MQRDFLSCRYNRRTHLFEVTSQAAATGRQGVTLAWSRTSRRFFGRGELPISRSINVSLQNSVWKRDVTKCKYTQFREQLAINQIMVEDRSLTEDRTSPVEQERTCAPSVSEKITRLMATRGEHVRKRYKQNEEQLNLVVTGRKRRGEGSEGKAPSGNLTLDNRAKRQSFLYKRRAKLEPAQWRWNLRRGTPSTHRHKLVGATNTRSGSAKIEDKECAEHKRR